MKHFATEVHRMHQFFFKWPTIRYPDSTTLNCSLPSENTSSKVKVECVHLPICLGSIVINSRREEKMRGSPASDDDADSPPATTEKVDLIKEGFCTMHITYNNLWTVNLIGPCS